MKIAVNTRLLLKNKLEGIGWVAFETLKRITQQHSEHEFYFIFDRKFDDSFIFSDNITPIVAYPQARHPFLYYIWFEYSIPRILKKIKADMFLSPDAYLSLSGKTKSLAIFHDLNFEHYPEDLPLLERKYYRYFFPKYARKADRIVTVSEFSRKDIINLYDVNPAKVDVVYNGANEAFTPLEQEEIKNVRNKYTRGKPYFVFVGALHPRKNLSRLFKAFDHFKTNTDSDTKLLIVGNKKWWTTDIEKAYESVKNKEDVVFSGRLEAAELHKVLGAARALTYVSYFEGFGIPIIEAYKCDVPVITSNVSSMPEISAGASLLVDPFSVSSIAQALEKIDKDENLRAELIEKGKERRMLFNWDITADNLWKSIEKVLESKK